MRMQVSKGTSPLGLIIVHYPLMISFASYEQIRSDPDSCVAMERRHGSFGEGGGRVSRRTDLILSHVTVNRSVSLMEYHAI